MKQLFLALTIGFTAMGCRDKEEPQVECGCNSPILNSESNGKELNGYIHLYNKTDNVYEISTYNGVPMPYESIVCNNDIIPQEIKNLAKQENILIEVVYKANFKKDCRDLRTTDYSEDYNIELIEIKLKK